MIPCINKSVPGVCCDMLKPTAEDFSCCCCEVSLGRVYQTIICEQCQYCIFVLVSTVHGVWAAASRAVLSSLPTLLCLIDSRATDIDKSGAGSTAPGPAVTRATLAPTPTLLSGTRACRYCRYCCTYLAGYSGGEVRPSVVWLRYSPQAQS